MKRLRLCCWLIGSAALLLMLCGTHEVFAQEVTATVTGTVTDPSGAAVVGATVTAKSVERGVAYSAVTNDSGLYRISQLPVGNYDLRIEKQGFQTTAYPAFALALNQIGRIDVELKVGQVTQTVEVTGEATQIETTNATVSGLVNGEQLRELPLNGRSYTDLALLNPGVI